MNKGGVSSNHSPIFIKLNKNSMCIKLLETFSQCLLHLCKLALTLFPLTTSFFKKSYDLFFLSFLFPFCKSKLNFHFQFVTQRMFIEKLSKNYNIHELL